MIRSTVIVEGFKLDLLADIATDFTYSIQDIRNPDKRTTDFSKTITLPGTPKNNALFAQIFNLNVENQYNPAIPNIGYNFNPNKVAKAVVLVDGIEIFNGILRVINVNIDDAQATYETNVLGRLSDILYALGDAKLSDIDFSDMDHTLSAAWIQGVWNNPASYRYTYPLIDYGLTVDNVNYPIEGFAPAIYVTEYINRMFADAGFTYNCSFFNTPYFQSLIIPSTEKDTFSGASQSVKYLQAGSRQREDRNRRTGEWREVGVWWYTPKPIDKYGFVTITDTDENVANHIKFTRDLETSVQFFFKYSSGSNGYINVRLNDNVLYNFDTGIHTDPLNPAIIVIEVEKRQYLTGDTLTLGIDIPPRGNTVFYSDTTVYMPSPTDTSAYPIDEGAQVLMSNFVSKSVAQKDLFKSLILMHNLYVFTDPDNDKNIFIVPQTQFYNTFAGDAVDWTHKVDYSKQAQIVPMGELTAREFLFTYKADTDYYNDTRYFKVYNEIYGQKRFVVDNDFEKDTTKIELIFSPTPSVQNTTNRRVIPHIYKVDNTTLAKSRDAFNIRILQYGGMLNSYGLDGITTYPWYIVDVTGTAILTCPKYPYAGMWDNPITPSRSLEWGPPNEVFFTPPSAGYPDLGLFVFYWKPYMLEISNKDSKLWRVYMLLTAHDINQLDFKTLVKVDNIYFKLNKVESYSPLTSDVTRVELFKTIVEVEIVRAGFILHEDGGYLIHEDGSSRIPYA